mmetsp:Transcript_8040/g.30163  ORF Transcript_8040/g.30163 Transcript_8040/m.30163 type:complete len:275 (-) Transcript_8040:1346-2170(-)
MLFLKCGLPQRGQLRALQGLLPRRWSGLQGHGSVARLREPGGRLSAAPLQPDHGSPGGAWVRAGRRAGAGPGAAHPRPGHHRACARAWRAWRGGRGGRGWFQLCGRRGVSRWERRQRLLQPALGPVRAAADPRRELHRVLHPHGLQPWQAPLLPSGQDRHAGRKCKRAERRGSERQEGVGVEHQHPRARPLPRRQQLRRRLADGDRATKPAPALHRPVSRQRGGDLRRCERIQSPDTACPYGEGASSVADRGAWAAARRSALPAGPNGLVRRGR